MIGGDLRSVLRSSREVRFGFVVAPQLMLRARKITARQSKSGAATNAVGPGTDRLFFLSELPQRFAFLLSGQNQIRTFGSRLLETRLRLRETVEPIQDRAAVI